MESVVAPVDQRYEKSYFTVSDVEEESTNIIAVSFPSEEERQDAFVSNNRISKLLHNLNLETNPS